MTAEQTPQAIRVTVHASAPVRYELRRVRPDWIVVDVLGAELGTAAGTLPFSGGAVVKIRIGQFAKNVVRVVVELTRPLDYRISASADATAVVITLPGSTATPAPPPPLVPGAAPASSDQAAGSIVFGQSIGRVRLGMRIEDVVTALGRAGATTSLPGLGTEYTWYGGPNSSGLGVRATDAGIVRQIWVLGDSRYQTQQGLHIGSSEADVQTALGPPSWTVAVSSQEKTNTLMYDALGVWFGIRPDDKDALQSRVFRIDVVERSAASSPPVKP